MKSAAAMPNPTDIYRLLEPDEPAPVLEERRTGSSNFVIVVDHASRRIPRRLGDLGLPPAELERHIAWDIGALGVATQVAAALDAPLVAQNYSRLVIDCNRDPAVASSIPKVGESIDIPGNIGLDARQAQARCTEIFDPYHRHIRRLLDERLAAGRPTILVAQHSMTNVFKGARREMRLPCFTTGTEGSPGWCWTRCAASRVLPSATMSRTSSATKPTTPFRAMPRRAACRMWRSRSVRIC